MKKIATIAVTLSITATSLFAPVMTVRADDTNTSASASSQYQSVKQRYENHRDYYIKLKVQYTIAIAQYRNLKEQYETAPDDATKEELRVKAVEVTETLLNTMEANLEMVISRVEMVDVDETFKQDLLNELENDLDWVQNKQIEINPDASFEALDSVIEDILEYWERVQVHMKAIVGNTLLKKSSDLLDRFDQLETELETKIDELEAGGKDVAELRAILEDYSNYLNQAHDKHEQAIAMWNEDVTDLIEMNRLFIEVHRYIKDSNMYLRQAWQSVRELIRTGLPE